MSAILDPSVAFVVLIALSAVATALGICRLIAGPTNADRIVALDVLLATGVVLCIGAGLVTGRTVFVDVGLGLALTGFVGTIGWARAVERGMPKDLPRDGTGARVPNDSGAANGTRP